METQEKRRVLLVVRVGTCAVYLCMILIHAFTVNKHAVFD